MRATTQKLSTTTQKAHCRRKTQHTKTKEVQHKQVRQDKQKFECRIILLTGISIYKVLVLVIAFK